MIDDIIREFFSTGNLDKTELYIQIIHNKNQVLDVLKPDICMKYSSLLCKDNIKCQSRVNNKKLLRSLHENRRQRDLSGKERVCMKTEDKEICRGKRKRERESMTEICRRERARDRVRDRWKMKVWA